MTAACYAGSPPQRQASSIAVQAYEQTINNAVQSVTHSVLVASSCAACCAVHDTHCYPLTFIANSLSNLLQISKPAARPSTNTCEHTSSMPYSQPHTVLGRSVYRQQRASPSKSGKLTAHLFSCIREHEQHAIQSIDSLCGIASTNESFQCTCIICYAIVSGFFYLMMMLLLLSLMLQASPDLLTQKH